MNRTAASMRVDLLIASNEIVIAAERGDHLHVTPYRGKCERRAILSYLECAGAKARAIVYSHEAPTGPVGVDVKSGEPYTWVGA